MSDDDLIPTIGAYRGVFLHDQQDEERLKVVRIAIDRVFDMSEPDELLAMVGDVSWPPEARLLAGAKLQAIMAIATDKRSPRPKIDLAYVRAATAGLKSQKWRDSLHFASLLDVPPRSNSHVTRPTPLKEAR